MSYRKYRWLKNQPKVIAYSATQSPEHVTWLAAAAIAAAGIVYLFGFFFSFSGGRAPAGS